MVCQLELIPREVQLNAPECTGSIGLSRKYIYIYVLMKCDPCAMTKKEERMPAAGDEWQAVSFGVVGSSQEKTSRQPMSNR